MECVIVRTQSGKVKKFERDAFGRLVKEFFPDETSVAYTYNAVGQLTNVSDQNRHDIKFDWSPFGLDAKTTAANQLTDYVYDQYGMLKAVESRCGAVTPTTPTSPTSPAAVRSSPDGLVFGWSTQKSDVLTKIKESMDRKVDYTAIIYR